VKSEHENPAIGEHAIIAMATALRVFIAMQAIEGR
jgi:hypothetical protein